MVLINLDQNNSITLFRSIYPNQDDDSDILDDSADLPAFTIINSARNLDAKKAGKISPKVKLNNLMCEENEEEAETEMDENATDKFTFGEKMSHKIDHAALVIFPIGFLFFMISYWTYFSD